ncbi:C40 family peptidase [Catenuloplanes atrovinosus]|uniref:Cell wall-associated NlpC family hydrolase n=1 Tax=Catenuloplanes atrovinosus TaxID=137266 RepID=A0AAE4CCV0_9ACTN|nr:NlpC/P60 family protein [Catenuloplanes atrovinosus]MDR7279538.1 cell wall-associated NlpC family hydrolase [Catenuloplanes atrovinosus]
MLSSAITRAGRVALIAAVLIGASAVPAGADPDAPPSVQELRQRLAAAAHELEVVIEEHNALREDLADTERRRREIGAEKAPVEFAMVERQERIGALAAAAYRSSGNARAVMIAAGGGSDMVERLLTLDVLARDQHRALEDLAESRARYAAMEREAETLAEKQREQQVELTLRKREIEKEIDRLHHLRLASGERVRPLDLAPPPPPSGLAGDAIRFAYSQLGKPYRWGADGPGSYDCSGLTMAAWERAGARLPHNAARQWRTVRRIGRDDLRPGDLVFYYGGISHVALYVGAGKMIHAPSVGENVRIDAVGYQPVHGYGRVVD